jgi:hypothetical protein
VNFEAELVVNGAFVAASRVSSWESSTDGITDLVMPPGIWRALGEYDPGPHQHVMLRIRVRGLPTVIELDRRLRALEQGHEPTPNVWEFVRSLAL